MQGKCSNRRGPFWRISIAVFFQFKPLWVDEWVKWNRAYARKWWPVCSDSWQRTFNRKFPAKARWSLRVETAPWDHLSDETIDEVSSSSRNRLRWSELYSSNLAGSGRSTPNNGYDWISFRVIATVLTWSKLSCKIHGWHSAEHFGIAREVSNHVYLNPEDAANALKAKIHKHLFYYKSKLHHTRREVTNLCYHYSVLKAAWSTYMSCRELATIPWNHVRPTNNRWTFVSIANELKGKFKN